MTPDPKPVEPDYPVEIIKDRELEGEALNETENIEKEGDPFGDNFA